MTPAESPRCARCGGNLLIETEPADTTRLYKIVSCDRCHEGSVHYVPNPAYLPPSVSEKGGGK